MIIIKDLHPLIEQELPITELMLDHPQVLRKVEYLSIIAKIKINLKVIIKVGKWEAQDLVKDLKEIKMLMLRCNYQILQETN